MNGLEYLKSKREEKHLSVRGFAAACGVAPRMVSYYESGEMQISSIPTAKAIRYFGILDIDIESFFSEYFPYKEDIDVKIKEWKELHPREYRTAVLKRRYYERIAKIKERNSISQIDLDDIINDHKRIFQEKLKGLEIVSDKEYELYILHLNYKIRRALNPYVSNRTSNILTDKLYGTEFSLIDISSFCGVSRPHLRGCIDGNFNIDLMRIMLALKICYILGLSFKEVFMEKV